MGAKRKGEWSNYSKYCRIKTNTNISNMCNNEVLYEAKYTSRGAPIKLIGHNKHAWTTAITLFPRDRRVKYIPKEFIQDGFLTEESLFDAVASVCKNDPVSVWLLLSFEDEQSLLLRLMI